MPEDAPLVLVVDDDPDILEFSRIVLHRGGYRVVCFTDADKAFEGMLETPPDLIVTDLMMGALDSGFALIQRIRTHPEFRMIPIIIITAVGSQRGYDFRPRDAKDLAAMQVDAFFAKPVEPKELIAKVHELLEQSKGNE